MALGIAAGGAAGVVLLTITTILATGFCMHMVKTLWDPKSADKMEEATQKCIAQFKEEVARTRTEMITQISEQIKTIFQEELMAVDGCFTDFRMSVNIDEQKIPMLEQKLLETQKLLEQIDMI